MKHNFYHKHIILCPNQIFEDNEAQLKQDMMLNKMFNDDILTKPVRYDYALGVMK